MHQMLSFVFCYHIHGHNNTTFYLLSSSLGEVRFFYSEALSEKDKC